MKKSPFVLQLNSAARNLLFEDGQGALRINTEGGEISFKSGKNTKAADAIEVRVPEKGIISAYIHGPQAGLFAKLLKKVGLTAEQPYALLMKGKGGWYHLKHAPDSLKSPGVPAIRAEVPESLEEVMTANEPSRRGRKPNSEKTGAGTVVKIGGISMKKKAIEKSDFTDESYEGWEKRVIGSMKMMEAAGKKAGRPSAELVEAQNTYHRTASLLHKIFGVPDYSSLIAECKSAIGSLTAVHDMLVELASNQGGVSQMALDMAREFPLPEPEAAETETITEAESSTTETVAETEDTGPVTIVVDEGKVIITGPQEDIIINEAASAEKPHDEPVAETDEERTAREAAAAAAASSKSSKSSKNRKPVAEAA